MKKLITVAVIMLCLIICLSACVDYSVKHGDLRYGGECQYCGKLKGEDRWFIAEVIDAKSVKPLGTDCFEAKAAGGAEIRFNFVAGAEDMCEGFAAGDIVRVTYNGYIMESFPVQIYPDSVELAQ